MKLDPVTKEKLTGSAKRVSSARAAVNAAIANDNQEALKLAQAELNAALEEQRQLEGTAAAAVHPPDPLAPYGWVPTTGAPGIEPVLRPRRQGEVLPGDTLSSPAPSDSAPADDGSLQIGKYRVTPLNQ
jgi:hypothetical protein